MSDAVGRQDPALLGSALRFRLTMRLRTPLATRHDGHRVSEEL